MERGWLKKQNDKRKPEGEMVPRSWDPSSEWAFFHFRERLTAHGGKFGGANGKMKEL